MSDPKILIYMLKTCAITVFQMVRIDNISRGNYKHSIISLSILRTVIILNSKYNHKEPTLRMTSKEARTGKPGVVDKMWGLKTISFIYRYTSFQPTLYLSYKINYTYGNVSLIKSCAYCRF